MNKDTYDTAIDSPYSDRGDEINVTVYFTYYPPEPQTYWFPGIGEIVEIDAIMHGNVDVYEYVDDVDIDLLRNEILQWWRDRENARVEDYAIAQWELRREHSESIHVDSDTETGYASKDD